MPLKDHHGSDRSLSPETRAVRMASDDMGRVIQALRDSGTAPFMGAKRSADTQARHALIQSSSAARDLLAQGHPMSLAERMARIERDERRADPLRDILPPEGQ